MIKWQRIETFETSILVCNVDNHIRHEKKQHISIDDNPTNLCWNFVWSYCIYIATHISYVQWRSIGFKSIDTHFVIAFFLLLKFFRNGLQYDNVTSLCSESFSREKTLKPDWQWSALRIEPLGIKVILNFFVKTKRDKNFTAAMQLYTYTMYTLLILIDRFDINAKRNVLLLTG